MLWQRLDFKLILVCVALQASFSGIPSWLRRKCFSHFPGLTGLQPPVLRAVVMGLGH